MQSFRFTGILAAVGFCLAVCAAKPYDNHIKSQVFHDDDNPIVAKAVELARGDQDSSKWMSWDPKATKNGLKDGVPHPKHEDPCLRMRCHLGRVCKPVSLSKARCECADESFCRGHNKPVCGSDGVMYPSHCELHRMACIKEIHIGIDHSTVGCKEKKDDSKSILQMKKDEKKEMKKEEEKVEQVKEEKKNDIKEEKKVEEEEEKDSAEIIGEEPVTLPDCTKDVYNIFKKDLLQFHCARIGKENCRYGNQPRKQFLANIMFSYYDSDNDQHLDMKELNDTEHRDHLEMLSPICQLTHMIEFDDVKEPKGLITRVEFFRAFNISNVLLDPNSKELLTSATIGKSIELKCDIHGGTDILWKRNGVELTTDTKGLTVYQDGSLYISAIDLHHIGNYSCQDRYNTHVVQTHMLNIQMPPKVRVSPSTQFHTSGTTVALKCHADGIPQPQVIWEMNEAPLPADPKEEHYVMHNHNSSLEIKSATYTRDTGAYKCKAKNAAGQAQDIATVFIENSKAPKYSTQNLYEVFVVFHDDGYTVYEPNHCHTEHVVYGAFAQFRIRPEYGDTVKSLCEPNKTCVWGSAVNIKNQYIYITQPTLNRVVVIEITERLNPIEIIPTDKSPVDIHYVEHLDQVWVTCWNGDHDTGSKTAVVIRRASEETQHHTVHTQPIGNHFDLKSIGEKDEDRLDLSVKNLFLPPNNDLKHKFWHGYVAHHEQMALYKLDLEAMKYVKMIDLKAYKCVPGAVAFIPVGGQIVVHCEVPANSNEKPKQLLLDYLTNEVLSNTTVHGEPHVSPDARHIISIDEGSDNIAVQKIQDDGKLKYAFDEYTNLHISDVTFFPSGTGHGYDFYASSSDKNDVLYINLSSGKVEMIEGVGLAMEKKDWPWSKKNRVIVSGGVFGEYLMTPSRSSVVVIDGKRRHVQCEWQDIQHGNVIVWVEPLHL